MALPTESGIVPDLHEIKICQRATKPKLRSFVSHIVIQSRRNLKLEFHYGKQFDGIFRGWSPNRSDRERLTKGIDRFFRQTITSDPTELNGNRECFRAAQIGKLQMPNITMMAQDAIFQRLPVMEGSDAHLEYRKLNGDRGVSTLFSRLGGNACGFVGADQKTDLYESNYREKAGKYAQNERVESNRIAPSSVPNYRESLPEGFGWLILAGILGGAALGGSAFGGLYWCFK